MNKTAVIFFLCAFMAFGFTFSGNSAFDDGVKAYEDGDLHSAANLFQKAVTADPKFSRAYSYLALVQTKLGQYDKAVKNYKQAYDLDNTDYASLTNLCGLLIDRQDGVGAYDYCSKAVELNPRSYVAYSNRCLLFIQGKRYDSAIADCSQALYIKPDYITAYINRAVAYDALGQYENAVTDYTSALSINPANALVYNNRCTEYKMLKQYDKAIFDCSKALVLDKTLVQAYANRGAVYEQMGDSADAVLDYVEYLKIYPGNKEIRARMSKLLEPK